MTKEQRAEALMAKGPIQEGGHAVTEQSRRAQDLMAKGPIKLVRRIMELEDDLFIAQEQEKALREALHKAAGHTMDAQSCPTCNWLVVPRAKLLTG